MYHLRNLPRGYSSNLFYLGVLIAVLLITIDLGTNFLLTDPQQELIYSDLISPLTDLLASVALVFAATQSFKHSKRLGIAWGLIALSVLVFALGDITWAILELGLNEPPFPSWADVAFLGFYPLMLWGLLLFPGPRRSGGCASRT